MKKIIFISISLLLFLIIKIGYSLYYKVDTKRYSFNQNITLQNLINLYENHEVNYDDKNRILFSVKQKFNDEEKKIDVLIKKGSEDKKALKNSDEKKQTQLMLDSLKLVKRLNYEEHLMVIDSCKKQLELVQAQINNSLVEIQNYLLKQEKSITFTYKNHEYYFFVASLRKHNFRLHWLKDSAKKHSNIQSVVSEIQVKHHEKPLLVTNAGMFEVDQKPLGLYIENYKQFIALNTSDPNDDNFYLMPNGVFFIDSFNNAYIKETNIFKKEYLSKLKSIKMATQSGPLLIKDNVFHPKFQANSTNFKARNGIGVRDNKTVIIGYCDHVNFYTFSKVFRDFFGCKNALFLDGAISKMYLSDIRSNELGGEFGPLISISEKEK